MTLLLVFGVCFLVVLVAASFLSPMKDDSLGCEDDIPCQECGRCYGDHLNANHVGGHTYIYPRDLHR